MVLTNFECWAHGGSDDLSANLAAERRANSVDLFNPTAIDQSCNILTNLNADIPVQTRSVSHLSSNGYYGFVPCAVVDNITPQHKALARENETNNKQNELVGAPIKNFGNKCGDDTIMDVEQQQEHVVFEQIRATSDSVVGSMFPQDRDVLAQITTFQTKCGNRNLDLHRRKRMFVEDQMDDGGLRMDCGITKRVRYGFNNCAASNDDNLPALFGNTYPDIKHSVMEQDDLDVHHSREDNTADNVIQIM